MYVPHNTKKIRPEYISKCNFECKVLRDNAIRENQVILIMITNDKKWHYLTAKRLPALLREITSNHNGVFYCLTCFHSYNTKTDLQIMKGYAKIKIFVTIR